MADIGTSTNLAADEAASGLARFVANNTNATQADFDSRRVHSGIGQQLRDYRTRNTCGMHCVWPARATSLGCQQRRYWASATAMTSLGINAEAGGTAFSRVWADMDAAVQTGNDDLEIFGRIYRAYRRRVCGFVQSRSCAGNVSNLLTAWAG